MNKRILLVGYDHSLLFTRACLLNIKWSAHIAYPSEALNILGREPFQLIVLCHTLPSGEAVSLAEAVRMSFPDVSVLALEALEASPGAAAHVGSWATASTLHGPSQMLDTIETLLDQRERLGPTLPDPY